MRVLIVFLSLFIFTGIYSQDQDGKWIKIAHKTVAFKSEKDVINASGHEKKVDKIKIKCTHGTVKLKHIWVEMSDGTKKDYDAKGIGILTKGMTSFAFDLPGNGESKLKKIELEYDSMGNMVVSEKAKVDILGRVSTVKSDN